MEKSKDEIITIFIRFLKEENVYHKFRANYDKLNNCYNSSKKRELDSFLYKNIFDLFIALAFRWDYSEEGWYFWHEIDAKWINYIREIIKK